MHKFFWACAMWLMLADQAALAADRVVQIESVQSNKCLDVSGFSKKPGAQIIQYSCTGGDNQKWAIKDRGNGVYDVTAVHSGSVCRAAASDRIDASMPGFGWRSPS